MPTEDAARGGRVDARGARPGGAVGIVGLGRLGRALAARLSGGREVVGFDVVPARQDQVARDLSIRGAPDLDAVAGCALALICTPGQAVLDVAATLRRRSPSCLLASLATVLPPEHVAAIRARGVVVLRMIGQFKAVELGLRPLFVAEADGPAVGAFAALLEGVGATVSGSEEEVAVANQVAATAALRACRQLEREWSRRGLRPEFLAPAVQNIVAGAAADYPPDAGNWYARAILRALTETEESPT
jgi:pyrroline-5-carboxylate reductase